MYQYRVNSIMFKHTCYYCGHEFEYQAEVITGVNQNHFQVSKVPNCAAEKTVFIEKSVIQNDIKCPHCSNINRKTEKL